MKMPMDSDQAEDKIKAVEKVLGEPVFAEFTANTWKIRTNLIFISVVSLVIVFADLHLEPDSAVLGLKFRGLSDGVLIRVLFWAMIYLLAHFIWNATDSLLEWRLRITGTRVAFVTTGMWADEDGDYPNNPRCSTLYNWWLDHAKRNGDLFSMLKKTNDQIAVVEALLASMPAGDQDTGARTHEAARAIGAVRESLASLNRSMDQTTAVEQSTRIPVSLKRFDRWFEIFLRSQNLRWLLIDFLAPVLLGGYAISLLFLAGFKG